MDHGPKWHPGRSSLHRRMAASGAQDGKPAASRPTAFLKVFRPGPQCRLRSLVSPVHVDQPRKDEAAEGDAAQGERLPPVGPGRLTSGHLSSCCPETVRLLSPVALASSPGTGRGSPEFGGPFRGKQIQAIRVPSGTRRRNSRDSPWKKTQGLQTIQRQPSGDRLRPGTIVGMLGWWVSAGPRVCSTTVMPSRATRRLGSVASVRTVFAEVRQRRLWTDFLFQTAFCTISARRMKTTRYLQPAADVRRAPRSRHAPPGPDIWGNAGSCRRYRRCAGGRTRPDARRALLSGRHLCPASP